MYASSKEEFENELEAMQKNALGLQDKNVARYDNLFNFFYISYMYIYN